MRLNTSVDILLATCNGEKFLPAQLESLAAQTDQDFRIIARDDSSSDRSVELLTEFSNKYPDKLHIIIDQHSCGSASANFSLLINASTAPYIMFCDQDDQWLPDKIEKTRLVMHDLETKNNTETPLLVHTDLAVVDEDLKLLDKSFWHFQKLNPNMACQLNRILVQNVVTGCTMMINRPLLNLGQPIATEAVMHDWWFALIACAFGAVDEIPTATMQYRQHGGNDTGAKQWNFIYICKKLLHLHDRAKLTGNFTRTCEQATAFLERFGDRLTENQRLQVSAYSTLPQLNWWARRRTILHHGFLKNGLIRNIGLLTRI